MPETKPDVKSEVLTQDLLESGARTFLRFLTAANELTTDIGRVLNRTGAELNTREWDALAIVSAYGPIRPSEILRHVVLTGNPQTLTSILARLEERNLVQRAADEQDARSVYLTTTEKGDETVEQLFPVIFQRIIEPFNRHFSDQELDHLNELITRLQIPAIG